MLQEYCAFLSILFGYSSSKSVLASRIDSRRSKNFLLSVKITFREITKHKSLHLKINCKQINFNKINSTKVGPNTHKIVKTVKLKVDAKILKGKVTNYCFNQT